MTYVEVPDGVASFTLSDPDAVVDDGHAAHAAEAFVLAHGADDVGAGEEVVAVGIKLRDGCVSAHPLTGGVDVKLVCLAAYRLSGPHGPLVAALRHIVRRNVAVLITLADPADRHLPTGGDTSPVASLKLCYFLLEMPPIMSEFW